MRVGALCCIRVYSPQHPAQWEALRIHLHLLTGRWNIISIRQGLKSGAQFPGYYESRDSSWNCPCTFVRSWGRRVSHGVGVNNLSISETQIPGWEGGAERRVTGKPCLCTAIASVGFSQSLPVAWAAVHQLLGRGAGHGPAGTGQAPLHLFITDLDNDNQQSVTATSSLLPSNLMRLNQVDTAQTPTSAIKATIGCVGRL